MTEERSPSRTFVDGLREARKVVERQTDLTELIHFERPSDYRKGVLTCLMALDKAIEEAARNEHLRTGDDDGR
jgi:hypothetical protein